MRGRTCINCRGEVPPGTAIPGPEFFGLTKPDIVEAIEELDAEHSCTLYWRGKQVWFATVPCQMQDEQFYATVTVIRCPANLSALAE